MSHIVDWRTAAAYQLCNSVSVLRKCCVMPCADAAALQALHTAEATMTVCEIVTHRIFVGLQHSRHLLRRPALWQHWLEVLDGLGGFVDLVPGRRPGQQASKPGEHGCSNGSASIEQRTGLLASWMVAMFGLFTCLCLHSTPFRQHLLHISHALPEV